MNGSDFHVVLVEPEIPQNTGSIGRLCLATGCTLHLVEPLGFDVSAAAVRRAGLDYWEHLKVEKLLEQLEIIRTTGYAIEIGENEEGSYCIAAPILDARNVAIAAMSLSAPISRYEDSARQAICAGLISATTEVGRILRGDLAETRAVA